MSDTEPTVSNEEMSDGETAQQDVNKRGYCDVSHSTISNSPPKKKLSNAPAPILFKKVMIGKVDKRARIEVEKALAKQCPEIKINRIKLTDAGNVLVFPETNVDSKAILEKEGLLNNSERFDLSTSAPRSLTLIVRGISGEDFALYDQQPLKQLGIIESRAMLNQTTGKQMNLTKIFFSSPDKREKILRDGIIRVGYSSYVIEEFGKTPRQCHHCRRFGHIASMCKKSITCPKCGGNHDRESCKESILKCVNCDGAHSAYWRGCPSYKRACQANSSETSSRSNNSSVPTGFHRNYSDAVRENSTEATRLDESISCAINKALSCLLPSIVQSSIESILLSRFNEFEERLESKLDDKIQAERDLFLSEAEHQVKETLKYNNERICRFFIDCYKILARVKPSKDQAKTIVNSLESLDLFDLKLDEFAHFVIQPIETKKNAH